MSFTKKKKNGVSDEDYVMEVEIETDDDDSNDMDER